MYKNLSGTQKIDLPSILKHSQQLPKLFLLKYGGGIADICVRNICVSASYTLKAY